MAEESIAAVRFDRSISIGAIMQAAVVAIGLIAWALTSANRAEQTGRDLGAFKADVSEQIKAMRADLGDSISGIRADIKTLPDQKARADNMERWAAQLDAKLNALETRTGNAERVSIENRSDLNAISQASSISLPSRRR